MEHKVQPTYEASILGGTAKVLGFGRGEDEFDWSLRNLKTEQDVHREENRELVIRLSEIVEQFSCNPVQAPHPTQMNSEIATTDKFSTLYFISSEWGGYTGREYMWKMWRGVQADGVRLYSGSFAMSAADCALIVVKWRDQMWAAHAGRDSLIDRKVIESGRSQSSKRYRSVVDSIIAEIPPKFIEEAEVFIGCTISKGPHFEHPIDDPRYGHFNALMINYISREYGVQEHSDSFLTRGQLDMRWLIRRQFEQFGVTKFEIDNICTFSDTNPNGSFTWHSNRRDRVKRNLFIVARL